MIMFMHFLFFLVVMGLAGVMETSLSSRLCCSQFLIAILLKHISMFNHTNIITNASDFDFYSMYGSWPSSYIQGEIKVLEE